jgi:hypothetical protein
MYDGVKVGGKPKRICHQPCGKYANLVTGTLGVSYKRGAMRK